jgi:hypothetical protein
MIHFSLDIDPQWLRSAGYLLAYAVGIALGRYCFPKLPKK